MQVRNRVSARDNVDLHYNQKTEINKYVFSGMIVPSNVLGKAQYSKAVLVTTEPAGTCCLAMGAFGIEAQPVTCVTPKSAWSSAEWATSSTFAECASG